MLHDELVRNPRDSSAEEDQLNTLYKTLIAIKQRCAEEGIDISDICSEVVGAEGMKC